jgi:hypothetical protein
MDDGDGAAPVEMMTGMPDQMILDTIYNGSAICTQCGSLMTPVAAMYTGTICPECAARKGNRRVANRMEA